MNGAMKDFQEKQQSQATQTAIADVSYVFQCDFCSKLLKTPTKFILHQAIHTGEKLFHCKFCVQSFVKPKKLLRHQRTHVENRPFQCRFCSESFKKPSKLIKHQSSHTNEKAIQCRFCLKTLSDPATFVDHVTLHCNGREDISPDNVDPNECATEVVYPNEITSSNSIQSAINHLVTPDICLDVIEDSEQNVEPSLDDVDLSPPTLEPITNSLQESEKDLDGLNACFQMNELATMAVTDRTSESNFSDQDVASENPELLKTDNKCPICDKEFSNKSYLTLHVKIHTNDRPHKCILCERQFLNSGHLIKHLASHEKLICCFCDKKYITAVSFFKHINFHVQNADMNCQFCSETFSDISKFRKHLMIHKAEDTSTVNDRMPNECKRKKPSMDAADANEKTSVLSRKEGSPLIKRNRSERLQFRTEKLNGYNNQEKPQNSKNVCSHCQKCFVKSSTLEKHIKKLHFTTLSSPKLQEETPLVIKPYTCKFCERTFTRVDYWQNHIKLVHNEKFYTCELCKRSFDTSQILKDHQKHHSSKTLHSCPVCQKLFIYKGALNSHIAEHDHL